LFSQSVLSSLAINNMDLREACCVTSCLLELVAKV
jgi:hypothetical protein